MLTRAAGGLGSRRVEELSAATVEYLLFLEAFFNNWLTQGSVICQNVLKLCMVYLSEDCSLGVGFFTAHRQSF